MSEEKEVSWATDEKLEYYTLSSDSYKLQIGEIIPATIGERYYMIKKIPLTDDNKELAELEEEHYSKVTNQVLPPLVSVIKDEKYIYHIFKSYNLESVSAKIGEKNFWQKDAAQFMTQQLVRLVKNLHKKDIFYLRETVDNVFFTSKNQIKVFGLDADAKAYHNYIKETDSEIKKKTDYFAIAEFLSQIMCGKQVSELQAGDVPDEIKTVIDKLTQKDYEKRKEYKLKKDEFFRPILAVIAEKESLQVGEFKVDWSEGGLVLGFGETFVGYRGGFYFESGGDSMTINGEGFTYESDTFTMSITAEGLTLDGNSNLPPSLHTHLAINAEVGFDCEIGGASPIQKLSLGPNGVEYVNAAHERLLVGPQMDCTLSTANNKIQQGPGKGGYYANVNGFFEALLGKVVYVRLGTCSLKVDPSVGMILRARPVEMRFLTSGNIELEMGGLTFSIGVDGLNLTMGNFLFKLKDTMRLECEGFAATVDGDGFHLENSNGTLDVAQYLKQIPKVSFKMPEIKAPPAPSVPDMTPSVGDILACCNLI